MKLIRKFVIAFNTWHLLFKIRIHFLFEFITHSKIEQKIDPILLLTGGRKNIKIRLLLDYEFADDKKTEFLGESLGTNVSLSVINIIFFEDI